ncbi:MAG: hypothetical protein JKY48_10150 [Flavobacteriales bacterium]|nr:hypothetical protein [Flavobacteriales bacterium]
MKRNYTLLFSLSLFSCTLFSQKLTIQPNVPPQEQAALSGTSRPIDPNYAKHLNRTSKATGDTLYFEDFGNGTSTSLPTGWTVFNNSLNNFEWTWNTIYQNGNFSAASDIISSPSVANGFMVLTADFFNTPIPSTGPVNMDTYFESPTITIASPKTSYWISYRQAVRYCCSATNRLVIQASTDNFVTYEEYDATNELDMNTAYDGVNIVKLGGSFCNASSFKIRFLSEGNSHYYWMIDDIAVIEGSKNDLELRDPYLEFNSNYTFKPLYYQIPYNLFSPMPVSGFAYNNGTNNATGVVLQAAISHQSYPNGTPGLGLIYSTNSSPQAIPSNKIIDSAIFTLAPDPSSRNPRFIPTVQGNFNVDILLTGDSIDEWSYIIGTQSFSTIFSTSDTILQEMTTVTQEE